MSTHRRLFSLALRVFSAAVVLFRAAVRSDERLEDAEELVGARDALGVFAVENQRLVVRRVGESEQVFEGRDALFRLAAEAEHLLWEAIVRRQLRQIFKVSAQEIVEAFLMGRKVDQSRANVREVDCRGHAKVSLCMHAIAARRRRTLERLGGLNELVQESLRLWHGLRNRLRRKVKEGPAARLGRLGIDELVDGRDLETLGVALVIRGVQEVAEHQDELRSEHPGSAGKIPLQICRSNAP